MQLPKNCYDCSSEESHLLTWIEGLEASSPGGLKSSLDRFRRPFGQLDSFPRPSKRKASDSPAKRQLLAPATDNAMSQGEGRHSSGATGVIHTANTLSTTPPCTRHNYPNEFQSKSQETLKPLGTSHMRESTSETGI